MSKPFPHPSISEYPLSLVWLMLSSIFFKNGARIKNFRIGVQVFRFVEELDMWETKQKTLC